MVNSYLPTGVLEGYLRTSKSDTISSKELFKVILGVIHQFWNANTSWC